MISVLLKWGWICITKEFSYSCLIKPIEEYLRQHSELSFGLPRHWLYIEIHINPNAAVMVGLEKLAMFGYEIKKLQEC